MIIEGFKFETTNGCELKVRELNSYAARLKISGAYDSSAYFQASDIKELRKFLKKLQKQLEQPVT